MILQSRWMPLVLVVFAAAVVIAQVTTADIVGTVTDNSGAAIANARVTVRNLDTALTRTIETTGSGDYGFTLLPIGNYALTVEASGFKMFSAPMLALASGDRVRINPEMQIGDVSQTVEVQESGTGALQTDSSTIGGLVTTQAVQNLPINGRNFISLVQLVPGANEGPATSTINGSRSTDRRQTWPLR